MLRNQIVPTLLLLLSPFAMAFAESPSGPKAGESLAELKVTVATGDEAGKEINATQKHSKGPVIFLFVSADKFDRPIGRFMRELDQQLIQKDRRDVQVIAVWLTDDIEKTKAYLPRVQQSLQLGQTTWTVFTGDRTGPQGWQIDPDRSITVLVAKDGKVIHSAGYDSINERLVEPTLKHLTDAK